jgi:hypothetical protein
LPKQKDLSGQGRTKNLAALKCVLPKAVGSEPNSFVQTLRRWIITTNLFVYMSKETQADYLRYTC